MSVQTTYPGVYIQELPSGVHTISGVSTSIAAFIGYSALGLVNQPVHIFSFADYQRAFGDLSLDSPMSYCVRDFFQNGGTEAYVVRVAKGAVAAAVSLKNSVSGTTDVLDITALGAGTWGNAVQVGVDYATADPLNLFNLSVTSFVLKNGVSVVDKTEVFRNLSMNSSSSSYVFNRVTSQIVSVSVPLFALSGFGTATTGTIDATALALLSPTRNRVAFTIDGQGPYEFTLTLPATVASIKANLDAAVTAQVGAGRATSVATTTLAVTSTDATIKSSFRFVTASYSDATAALKMGNANGGTDVDLAANYRPVQTGTVSAPVAFTLAGTSLGQIKVNVFTGSTLVSSITLPPMWTGTAPTDLAGTLVLLRTVLANATDPLLAGATASIINGVLRIVPGSDDPARSFTFDNAGADTTATDLKLTLAANAVRNVGRYALGTTISFGAQLAVAGAVGNNGIPPGSIELRGQPAQKTGMYALENVDLFNLMVIPEATATNGLIDVLTEAIAYCTKRRAFMIIDAPENVKSFADAQSWMASSQTASLFSRNSALYFPRFTAPDPLMGVVRPFPAAGALAGLYARTDSDRGVWKAPAGTAATITGATGLTYTLTDGENGALNPVGLNCLRTFPVYGTVSWGARTGKGADAQADEYKYIPVRRLALFLEESLYRGTQWAVFEPNDEPLWASIRLNLGAFMHQMFAQGAFQGRTPSEAYFVHCDKTTTTQNDIDQGRVNIIVGFAPLKPAEFVVISFQQMAGQIVT